MPAVPRRRRKQFYVRRKVCRFCVDSKLPINYKDITTLRQFITERGESSPGAFPGIAPAISAASPGPSSRPGSWR